MHCDYDLDAAIHHELFEALEHCDNSDVSPTRGGAAEIEVEMPVRCVEDSPRELA